MSRWSASAQEIRGEAQHWDAQAQTMAKLKGLLDQLQLIKPGYDNVGFFQAMVDAHTETMRKARALDDQAGTVFGKIGDTLVGIAGVYEATDARLSGNLRKTGSTPVPLPRPRP
jgi:hypothetical protein